MSVPAKSVKSKYVNNPLLSPHEITLKERTVKVGSARELVDMSTGELTNVNAIYQRKIVDSERFAKIYLEGVRHTFGLTKTAQRVFQIVLQCCDKDSDRLYLNFMVVAKHDSTMTERTYHRGLLELLKAGFLAYSDLPNMLWINPHLFFNGDRVRFITEYVKESKMKQADSVK